MLTTKFKSYLMLLEARTAILRSELVMRWRKDSSRIWRSLKTWRSLSSPSAESRRWRLSGFDGE